MKIQHYRTHQGFTLVEMLVALTVGSLVTIIILSSFRSLSTSLAGTENYRDMHHDVRYAMDVMRRDITKGSSVSECVASNRLVMLVESAASNTVSVAYNLASNSLARTEASGSANTLATGVDKVTFTLYDKLGAITSVPADAYFVGVKMEMKTRGVREVYADELQTRNRMRAKGL